MNEIVPQGPTTELADQINAAHAPEGAAPPAVGKTARPKRKGGKA